MSWRQQKQQCLFSLLRFFDKLFDVINDVTFFDVVKDSSYRLRLASWAYNFLFFFLFCLLVCKFWKFLFLKIYLTVFENLFFFKNFRITPKFLFAFQYMKNWTKVVPWTKILHLYGITFHPAVVLGPEHDFLLKYASTYCPELRFASFLSGGFTTMLVINPPETHLCVLSSLAAIGSINYAILI